MINLTLQLFTMFNNEFQVHKKIKSDKCDLVKNLIPKVSFWVQVENMALVEFINHYVSYFKCDANSDVSDNVMLVILWLWPI